MKKLTFKNFAVGLAVTVAMPLWIPLLLLGLMIATVCEIGRGAVLFFTEE